MKRFVYMCALLLSSVTPAHADDVIEGFVVPQGVDFCPILKTDLSGMQDADMGDLSATEQENVRALLGFHQFLMDSGLSGYCLVQVHLPDGSKPEIFISETTHNALFAESAEEMRAQKLVRRVKLTVEELTEGDYRALKGSKLSFVLVPDPR